MPEIASAWVSILPEMKGFGSRVTKQAGGDVQKSGKKLGSSFGKAFAAVAAVGIGAKVGNLFLSSISSAGDLEQSIGAVNTVFKRSAGQMNSWGKNAAQSVGLTRNEFNELGTLIGTQLRNGGTAMDELAPKTNKLITLGADLSSMFGGTTKDAVAALSSALKGERDPIEAFGVSLSQAKIDAEAASLGFEKVGGSLSAEANQAATLSLIMKQTADAHGNFAKESGTLAGQQQRLAAQWGDMKAQLGTALLPVVSRFVGFLNKNLRPSLARVRDAVVPVVTALRDNLGPVVQRVMAYFKDNPTILKGAAIALGVLAVAIGGVSLAMGVLSLATSPITLVILAVAALGAGIAHLWRNSETFRNIVARLGAGLQAFGAFVKAEILPVILQTAHTVATKLAPVWRDLAEFFRGTVAPILAQVAVKLREWWPTIQRVTVALARLTGAAIQLWASIQAKVIPVLLRASGVFLRTYVPAALAVIGVIVKIIGRMAAFGSAMTTGVKKVGQFAAGVAAVIGKVLGWFRALPGRVLSNLGDVGNLLYESGKKLVGGLVDGLEAAKSKVTDKIKDIAGSITSHFPFSPVKKGPLRAFNGGKPGIKLMEMLASGVRKGGSAVFSAVDAVAKGINDALKKGTISKGVANQMRQVVKTVAKEANKLRSLIAARGAMASSVASNLKGEFNLSELFGTNEFGISTGGGGAVKAAQAVVARMKAFARKLVALTKAGMPAALVQEIAGYGSVDGSRVADSFLKASKSDQRALKTSYSEFNRYANAAGSAVANATYGKRIEGQKEALDQAAEIGKQVRKALTEAPMYLRIGKDTVGRVYIDGKAVADARR